MLTEKDYCDYDTCVALKELGFNTLVDWYFNENKIIVSPLARCRSTSIPRISLYQAQKWLREVHNLHIEITYSPSCWTGKIYDLKKEDYIKGFTFFKSFEETLHTLIKEAIKILKEKEFHNLRKAFYIDELIVWIPQGKSHKEYFDSINHSDFIETKVRGYILNDTLNLYKGSDFSIPPKKEVENIISLFASFNIKQINLGCNIGNIGEVWKPKEIIKLLKEEK